MLKKIIQQDTGLISKLLLERNRLTIQQIALLTGYREMYLYLPIGWLVGENKIVIIEKDGLIYIDLIQDYAIN